MPLTARWGHIIAIPAAGLMAACADIHSSGFQVVGSVDGASNVDVTDSASSAAPVPDTTTTSMMPADSATTAQDEAGAANEASTGDDGGSTAASDASGTATSDTGVDDGATPGSPESGTQEAAAPGCPAPSPNGDSLPFAVDGAGRFIPSGYEGDSSAVTMPTTDLTCGGHRARQGALGNCHSVTYTPSTAAGSQGWAGIIWQHPTDNWGAAPGYAIPPGASKVSFWARGGAGGEDVTFLVGGIGSSTTTCADTVSNKLANIKLSTAFTQYTISLRGVAYGGGVLGGFGFVLAAADQPTRDGGSTTLFIDDIEWQR